MWFGLLVWCRAESCSTMSCLRFTRDSLKLSARSVLCLAEPFSALASARVLSVPDQNLLAASFDQSTWSLSGSLSSCRSFCRQPSCSWNCAFLSAGSGLTKC
ncbi:Hypothetical_protein [Hexamita inflata]|uniref:Hypothetical_protein n=1 Tax=Hexamita inflata TaxID=28002 RepID=A0ABP1HRM1_9EUKA